MREYDLPSLALSYVDCARGTFSTWLPTDVSEEAAQCFEVGFWRIIVPSAAGPGGRAN